MSEDRLSQLPEDGNLEDSFLDPNAHPNVPELAQLNDEIDGNLNAEIMGINSFDSFDCCRSFE